jgi:hypothetical protein
MNQPSELKQPRKAQTASTRQTTPPISRRRGCFGGVFFAVLFFVPVLFLEEAEDDFFFVFVEPFFAGMVRTLPQLFSSVFIYYITTIVRVQMFFGRDPGNRAQGSGLIADS